MPPASRVIVTGLMGLIDNRPGAQSMIPAAHAARVGRPGVNFFGDNLIVLLMLAMGGALALGNFMALVRPNPDVGEGELERAPLGRALVMIGIGLVAAIWAIVSLVSG